MMQTTTDPTQQRELDHTYHTYHTAHADHADHTDRQRELQLDHTDQEYIYPKISKPLSVDTVNELPHMCNSPRGYVVVGPSVHVGSYGFVSGYC